MGKQKNPSSSAQALEAEVLELQKLAGAGPALRAHVGAVGAFQGPLAQGPQELGAQKAPALQEPRHLEVEAGVGGWGGVGGGELGGVGVGGGGGGGGGDLENKKGRSLVLLGLRFRFHLTHIGQVKITT